MARQASVANHSIDSADPMVRQSSVSNPFVDSASLWIGSKSHRAQIRLRSLIGRRWPPDRFRYSSVDPAAPLGRRPAVDNPAIASARQSPGANPPIRSAAPLGRLSAVAKPSIDSAVPPARRFAVSRRGASRTLRALGDGPLIDPNSPTVDSADPFYRQPSDANRSVDSAAPVPQLPFGVT